MDRRRKGFPVLFAALPLTLALLAAGPPGLAEDEVVRPSAAAMGESGTAVFAAPAGECGRCTQTDDLSGYWLHQFVPDYIVPTHECSGGGGHPVHDCVNGDGIMWTPEKCEVAHDECPDAALARSLTNSSEPLSIHAAMEVVVENPTIASFNATTQRLEIQGCGGVLVAALDVVK